MYIGSTAVAVYKPNPWARWPITMPQTAGDVNMPLHGMDIVWKYTDINIQSIYLFIWPHIHTIWL